MEAEYCNILASSNCSFFAEKQLCQLMKDNVMCSPRNVFNLKNQALFIRFYAVDFEGIIIQRGLVQNAKTLMLV